MMIGIYHLINNSFISLVKQHLYTNQIIYKVLDAPQFNSHK